MPRSVVALVLVTVLAPAAHAAALDADIVDFLFVPDPLFADAGDAITWTNRDAAPHTVTCDDGACAYASEILLEGDAFTGLVAGSGTQTYYCVVHPDMRGAIHVGTGLAADADLAPDAASLAVERPLLLGLLPDPTLARVSAAVSNVGARATPAVEVAFSTKDVTGATVVVARGTLPALAAGETARVVADWSNPPLVGERTVTVSVDVANAAPETSERNNVASATVRAGLF